MKLSASDIETLLFWPDDGSVSHAVKLVYLPNGQEYVCNDCESQTANRRQAVELLLRDLISTYPNVSAPKAILFDCVRILEPNTPREGMIREMIWHAKDSNWNYYIESEGKNISKRYVDSDIEHIDR